MTTHHVTCSVEEFGDCDCANTAICPNCGVGDRILVESVTQHQVKVLGPGLTTQPYESYARVFCWACSYEIVRGESRTTVLREFNDMRGKA